MFLNHVLGGDMVEPRVPDPALFATTNLMRYYNVDETHANHVADLALSIFDQLAPVHGLDAEARRLLQIAALLHDVGIAVNFYNHDEHGFYLLTRTGIDGLTHRELLMVAGLVAAHNGNGGPLKRQPEYRSLLEKHDLRHRDQARRGPTTQRGARSQRVVPCGSRHVCDFKRSQRNNVEPCR